MSSSLPPELPGKLPKSSLVSVEDLEKAIAKDININQILDSLHKSESEISEVAAQIINVAHLKRRREALKNKIARLHTALRKRREQICKNLVHEKIKEARRDLGVHPNL